MRHYTVAVTTVCY